MKDKATERWSTYEPYYVLLGDHKVADIVITKHASLRWNDRLSTCHDREVCSETIAEWMWTCLKQHRVTTYFRQDKDVYLVDDDVVLVAEMTESDRDYDLTGEPMSRMIIITFLGRMSETLELRDLKTYYSWLRHSRRMTLVKNSRKHR